MSNVRPSNGPLIAIVALVVAGWLFIAVTDDNDGGDSIAGAVLIGVLLGTIFGQISLAATWCALGPFSLATRLPLSAGWIAVLVLALGCLISRDGPSDGALMVTLIFGCAFTGQWILVQAPMWAAAVLRGLRICHSAESEGQPGLKHQQFGIRQLMTLTLVVGVVMGTGRLLFGGSSATTVMGDWRGMFGIFVVAFCHALIALPLVAAALLRRNVSGGVCAALFLTALAATVEVPLLRSVQWTSPSDAKEYLMMGLVSGTQAAWVLGIVCLLRMAGYGLVWRAGGNKIR